MCRRRVAFGQRTAVDVLEIGDARVAPPLSLLLLDREECRDLGVAFGVDRAVERAPGFAHPLHFIDTARVAIDEFIPQCPSLSLIHISEPTSLLSISYAVFCLKKK